MQFPCHEIAPTSDSCFPQQWQFRRRRSGIEQRVTLHRGHDIAKHKGETSPPETLDSDSVTA